MYNFNAYQEHILRHAKPLPLEVDLQHFCLGLNSEIGGELNDPVKGKMIYGKPIDPVNIMEEVGDAQWFASLGCRLIGIDFQGVMDLAQMPLAATNPDKLISYVFRATDAASQISMYIDRRVEDGEPINISAVTAQMIRMFTNLHRVGEILGFTLADAAEANKRKLDLRYPGGVFDAGKGLNRDKVAERLVLGGLGVIDIPTTMA